MLFYTEVIGFLVVIIGFTSWVFIKALRQALNPKDAFKVDSIPQVGSLEENKEAEPWVHKP
jgi:hypothetical protein